LLKLSDFIRKFGYNSIATGHYTLVKKELKRRNIDIPSFEYFQKYNNFKRKRGVDELFIYDTDTHRGYLKKRIIEDDLIDYKCKNCGISGEWNGKKLILQLEHINGDACDNRLDNLCFLCPNCHSQTDSYNRKKINKIKKIKYCECGKKISNGAFMCVDCNSKTNRVVDRPTHEDLKKEIEETSQNKVAKKYNVSWKTIRKC